MDPEDFGLPEQTAKLINDTKTNGKKVVAVGSTVLRALESSVQDGMARAGDGSTSLFITPGHRFQLADALLTNFHLPRSTLLMLVSAFAGREFALEAYEEAVREQYRFFSYGDAMLIV